MSLNRKNQTISRQLTLEQIIQKSAIRKNIDSININQTLNTHRSNQLFTSNNQPLPIPNAKNININRFGGVQKFNYKHEINDSQQGGFNGNKLSIVRVPIFKETCLYNFQMNHQQNKNTLNHSDKLKQFKSSQQLLLCRQKRKDSSKSKPKKYDDYLCIKGSSGNPFDLKPQNHILSDQHSPQFEITNYQTLNDLPSQTNKQQKSTQLIAILSLNENMKKQDSFMLSKNRTVNNFRQKTTKLLGTKNSSKNDIKKQFIFPDQIINKIIQDRAVKTQQKQRGKPQIDSSHRQQVANSNQKIKNIQLFRKSSNKESPTKQSISFSNTILRSEDMFKDPPQQNLKSKVNKNNSPSKQCSENSLRQTKIKGFRGTKIMSISEGEKIKSRYFIPDFLKPSLDPIMFEKKLVDVIKARESENLVNKDVISLQNSRIKQQNPKKIFIEDQQQVNKKLQQIFLRLKTTKQEISQQRENNEQQVPDLAENNEPLNINQKQTKHKKTEKRQYAKEREKTDLFEDHQICGWEDNQNQEKPVKQKNKKRAFKFAMDDLLEF